MLEKIVGHLFRQRRMYVLGMVALTLFFTFCASGLSLGGKVIFKGLRVDNSMDAFFADGSPAWKMYKHFQEQFGNDEYIVIAFERDNIFTF